MLDGYAAISEWENIQLSLPTRASVFTAELSAIWSALKIIKGHPPKRFVIFSDLHSAVEAILNFHPKNSLVQEIKYCFHMLYVEGKHI